METELIPHKALNDVDSMYFFLMKQLKSAKQITDLIPFINNLLNIDDLKQQLLSSLNEQFKISKSKETSIDCKCKIRPLFISLFSLNGIPSDIIHAKIISFLSSTEYKKLPILSKHWRNIMKNNQFIFNEKGYSVSLSFDTDNLSKNKDTKISIQHDSNSIRIFPPSFIGSSSFRPKGCLINEETQKHSIIELGKIKSWRIQREYTLLRSYGDDLTPSEDISILDDKHNIFALDLLYKHHHHIEKLQIDFFDKNIISKVFEQNQAFNHLYILNIRHHFDLMQMQSNWCSNIKFAATSFGTLEYIELSSNESYECINNIIQSLSNTLKAIRITAPRSILSHRRIGNQLFDQNNILKIPSKMEWIFCKNIKFAIDLSECHQLIAIKLFDVDSNHVIWPNNECLIPFLCLNDKENGHCWTDIILKKQINAKFVSLKKEERITRNDTNTRRQRLYRRETELVFNDDCNLKRSKIDDILIKSNDNDKCLVLDKTDINDQLFYKILRYSFNDNNLRDIKLKQCQKWFRLQSAEWIKNLDDHS